MNKRGNRNVSRQKQIKKLRELRDRNAETIAEQEKLIRKLEQAFVVAFSIGAILMMTLIAVIINRPNKYDLNNDGTVDIKDLFTLEEYLEGE